MINLNNYKANAYSQYGEDGIIEQLLGRLDEPTGFVIEFGAADGTFCSNTARLWRDVGGYEALLIESDQTLYDELVEKTSGFDGVECKHGFVTNIDDYTTRVADVCSIDVDGDDYQIVERMTTNHQIVVVEHNPTVPPHVMMIGYEGAGVGSSAAVITELMAAKGYTLVAATKTNVIFLYGDHHEEFETSLEVLFDYSALNYVVTSYNGVYDMIGEFGYGFDRPGNLQLHGPDNMVHKTVDSTTKEYMRQVLHYADAKGETRS